MIETNSFGSVAIRRNWIATSQVEVVKVCLDIRLTVVINLEEKFVDVGFELDQSKSDFLFAHVQSQGRMIRAVCQKRSLINPRSTRRNSRTLLSSGQPRTVHKKAIS